MGSDGTHPETRAFAGLSPLAHRIGPRPLDECAGEYLPRMNERSVSRTVDKALRAKAREPGSKQGRVRKQIGRSRAHT